MIYFIIGGAIIGVILAMISERPPKAERIRRAEVQRARDNFYLREEEKHRSSR